MTEMVTGPWRSGGTSGGLFGESPENMADSLSAVKAMVDEGNSLSSSIDFVAKEYGIDSKHLADNYGKHYSDSSVTAPETQPEPVSPSPVLGGGRFGMANMGQEVPPQATAPQQESISDPGSDQRSGLLQALAGAAQRPTVEAPVTQAPDPKLRILQALSSIAGPLLGIRDQRATDKRNRASQATANVVNALSKGRAGARGLREEAKPGILTQLSQIPGQAAGIGLQVQADKQAAEQAAFENQISASELSLKAQDSESERLRALLSRKGDLPTAGQNKVAMMEKGRDLFDTGRPRSEVQSALENDLDFKELVSANPQIATEMVGNALKGFDAREQGVFDREIADAREDRAKDAAKRSEDAETRTVREFTDRQIDRIVNSYTRRLSGAVSMAGTKKGSQIEDPGAFFKEHQIEDMIGGSDPTLALDLESAYQEQVGAYAKARVEYWNDQREIARQKQRDTLGKAKQDFTVTDTLRKSIMALQGVKSFSGSQGLGPSFARMKRFHQDYRDNPDMAGRAEAQIAMVNQFQRLIDPATVRSQDIELYRDALSTMANIEVALIRVGKGGFLPDDMIDGMMQVAISLHEAQRDFVESEVQAAISLWDALHPGFAIGNDEAVTISQAILGGKRTTDVKEETPRERAARERSMIGEPVSEPTTLGGGRFGMANMGER
jgi:hypothetical protein